MHNLIQNMMIRLRGQSVLAQLLARGIIVPVAGGMVDVAQYPLLRHIYAEQYVDPEAKTATFNGATLDLKLAAHREISHWAFVYLFGAITGTSPTLDIKLQTGATLADLSGAAIPQIIGTDDNKFAAIEVPGHKLTDQLRAVHTIAGTSPSFTMSCLLLGYRYEGEFPVPAAADRLSYTVVPA